MAERILIQKQHPDGTHQAIVEDDEQTVVLYLHGPTGLRGCWVRNRAKAPRVFDPRPAKRGSAPMQPAAHCVNAGPQPPLDPSTLSIVWLQEGDGAALLDGDEVLAVLPSWAGTKECPGYSSAAFGTGPVAWSLQNAADLEARVLADKAWWASWREGDPFSPVRDAQVAALKAQIGPMERYFAIDGGAWPPRGMAVCDRPPGKVAMTLGMGIRRQPMAERFLAEGTAGTRIELAMALHPTVTDPDPYLKALAGLAGLPWAHVTWLGAGHTIAHPRLPAPFGALFLHPAPPTGVELGLPEIGDEAVQVLWVTPITAAERALAQEYGRDVLAERLGEALSQVCVRQPVA